MLCETPLRAGVSINCVFNVMGCENTGRWNFVSEQLFFRHVMCVCLLRMLMLHLNLSCA